MQFAMAFKIIGVLLILFSSTMLPSLLLSVISQDGIESAFAIGFGATLAAGVLLWLPNRLRRRDLNIRDGFLVTALFWIVLGLFGAIPLWITPQLNLSPVAAIFESISGLTTTGATVITGLDALPRSLLLYRQLLQWLGGIGIIVLAVAILPMLGIGGMQLYRAGRCCFLINPIASDTCRRSARSLSLDVVFPIDPLGSLRCCHRRQS